MVGKDGGFHNKARDSPNYPFSFSPKERLLQGDVSDDSGKVERHQGNIWKEICGCMAVFFFVDSKDLTNCAFVDFI